MPIAADGVDGGRPRGIRSPEYARNYGFWSGTEQEALLGSHVAIAGLGGDGYQLGLKLARMGVRSFAVADPEVFERENVNRVPGAVSATIGRLKALAFADDLRAIDPEAAVSVHPLGIEADSVDGFVAAADLVIDETELTRPRLSVLLARAARRADIPVLSVLNVGWAAQATSFAPRSRFTVERMLGAPDDAPLERFDALPRIVERSLARFPHWADTRGLAALSGPDPASIPSIAPGVDLASAIGCAQAFLHLTRGADPRRPEPVWAPRAVWMDASSPGSSAVVRTGGGRSLPSLIRAALRTRLGANPAAGLDPEAGYC